MLIGQLPEHIIGVKIDSQLSFNNHLETIIKKASQKVHVLARITPICVFQKESY